MKHELRLPVEPEKLKALNLGDIVYLNGLLVTARDQAHRRILESNSSNTLPPSFKTLKNSAIYHCGPIIQEKRSSYRIISGGPTTSQRMDSLQNQVVEVLQVKFIIGKGGMKSLNTQNYKVVYLSYTGGCGALINKKVKEIIQVVWKDLGICEAVWFLDVENFGPLIVTQLNGKSLYI
ncbi:MAG: putative L(+)-tartrate dehydratase subunit beta [Promethearchaeota archaeon]|nr:MAG: putative L(+)-tartrate dehydratase subunit beta [Candidatus Lokiarchaeota archaeon]